MITLTRAQLREVDGRAIEEYRIPGIVLMENAALAAANVAQRMIGEHGSRGAHLLCGGGNNGGDGLAIARHLHNRGIPVALSLTIDPDTYKGDALINWRIVQAMRLPATRADPAAIGRSRDVLVIDAIFGTGLAAAPREPFAAIVNGIASSNCPVLAIDVPSGLDCDTGHPLGPCVRADATITFVARKPGFTKASEQFTGPVLLGDIGCPRELIEAVANGR